jgi:predicted dehydrogenase
MLRRRDVLKSAAALAAAPYFAWSPKSLLAAEVKSDRLRIGAVGLGGRGSAVAAQAGKLGTILAVCDVDQKRAETARNKPDLGKGEAEAYTDYRKLFDRKDIDVVTIGTPDHWHTKIALDAMRAGKDVYCEKPLTLTVDEGKILSKAVKETGRVFQVGTQQRSEYNNMFLNAAAIVRDGRLGKINRVTCAIGGVKKSGTLQKTKAPPELNWDMWLGQTPLVDYIKERCHYDFRWWYEYSGGKMTDWGAHHVDITHWALGLEATGPTSFEVLSATHDVPFEKGWPTVDDRYNVALAFHVLAKTADGTEIHIRDEAMDLGFDNGILFEGEKGNLFVNRSKLTGEQADALKDRPIDRALLTKMRNGKPLGGHMQNFFDCIRDRGLPVSDVHSHHRAMTTCHLANIAMRLGRTLKWDPAAEQITGDDEANGFLKREQRKGYETV